MTKLYLQRGRSSVLAATTLMTLHVPYERALGLKCHKSTCVTRTDFLLSSSEPKSSDEMPRWC